MHYVSGLMQHRNNDGFSLRGLYVENKVCASFCEQNIRRGRGKPSFYRFVCANGFELFIERLAIGFKLLCAPFLQGVLRNLA